jgi:hypothetical protein
MTTNVFDHHEPMPEEKTDLPPIEQYRHSEQEPPPSGW